MTMRNFTMRTGFNVMSAAIGGLVAVNTTKVLGAIEACILGFVIFLLLLGLSNLLLCIAEDTKIDQEVSAVDKKDD